jgi:3-(3-hydroxy-phenyl)propionate hydroxylase
MPDLLAHTCPFGHVEFRDEVGSLLLRDAIADPDAPHGYAGSRFFDQPAFERVLREGLARYPHVSVWLGARVLAVADHGELAEVTLQHGDGEPRTLRAAFVVGCDGGRSSVRAGLGVAMDSLAPGRQWLIVDTVLRDPADAARLPNCFRYHLAHERLTIYAHGIGDNRRWEFQLGVDEPPPDEPTLRTWLARYVDPDRVRITRISQYVHNSLLARSWRVGRVLVAGDAAHMMPTTAGQGMCAGIRDAINLAWKLHLVTRGLAAPGLLDSYEAERKPHVHEILKGALFINQRLAAESRWQRWRRRHELRLISALPRLQALLRRFSLRRPHLRRGCLDAASRCPGQHLPQVQVHHAGRAQLLDDLLGYRFVLVIRAEYVTVPLLAWAEARAIGVFRPGADFVETTGALAAFMHTHNLDFALVRPDRHIFGAGRADELARVQAALAEQLAA